MIVPWSQVKEGYKIFIRNKLYTIDSVDKDRMKEFDKIVFLLREKTDTGGNHYIYAKPYHSACVVSITS
jgi:hypothetical protein